MKDVKYCAPGSEIRNTDHCRFSRSDTRIDELHQDQSLTLWHRIHLNNHRHCVSLSGRWRSDGEDEEWWSVKKVIPQSLQAIPPVWDVLVRDCGTPQSNVPMLVSVSFEAQSSMATEMLLNFSIDCKLIGGNRKSLPHSGNCLCLEQFEEVAVSSLESLDALLPFSISSMCA